MIITINTEDLTIKPSHPISFQEMEAIFQSFLHDGWKDYKIIVLPPLNYGRPLITQDDIIEINNQMIEEGKSKTTTP